MSFLGTIDMSLSSHTFHIWNALFFALLPGSSYVVLFLIASEKCQATTVKACLSFPGRSKKRVPPFLKNRESVIFHVEKKNHHVTCTWPISTFVSRDWRGRSTSLLLFFSCLVDRRFVGVAQFQPITNRQFLIDGNNRLKFALYFLHWL